ncbi:trimethylamine methyltransferase family protein [Candidatus Formimonas warabiya]|nr:trimethylamine methyltransferase family protein [Candidatus Formimonas warabiya]
MDDNFVRRQTIGMGAMTQQEKERLHAACLEVLERVGVQFYDEEALKILKDHGAQVDGEVARISPKMIEEAIESAPGRVVIYDRNGAEKMSLEKGSFYFGTGSDTPYVQDFETNQVRRAVLQDTINGTIVADALPNIDFIMSMGLASDAPVPISDIHQFVAMLRNSTKPIIVTAHDEINTKTMIEIDELVIGCPIGEKPNLMLYNEPSSPLRHAREVAQKAILAADTGMPITYVPATMIGGASPITVAGGLVVAVCELLSGLVLHQCRRPGAPFIFGGAATPLDMKTGSCCYNAPEGHLNAVYLAEMGRYYDLPLFTWGGSSDAITFDQQASMEAMFSLLINAMNGGNLIHDVGFLGQGMVYSIDSLVACHEMIGLVKRLIRGIDLSDEKLLVDTICQVGIGGSFLQEDTTARYFREEIWLPELINRDNIHNVLAGGGSFAENIKKKIKKIMTRHKPVPIPKEIDQKITAIMKSIENRELSF